MDKSNVDYPHDNLIKKKTHNVCKALITRIISLPPKQFVLLSTLLGIILIDEMDAKDQLILGKFINNISNTIFTAAAQEQILKRED
ncbi:MAG TPA: hypothetical protein PLV23_05160 [Sedimentibacter sp.]|jgi:hypothetical protein|nr:hypothetical protein [Sedimentibacter sp.]HOK49603.1 hypothetical protein [Sedimentibacter sp.]HOW22999.1 hypothetical protein [Sedimentibacter sp.]HRC80236.1 hypothetical protein [Sedimentibacter sp.]